MSARVLGSLVDPAWLAERVAADYALVGPVACRLVSANDNDHYRVDTGDGPRILRVYRHNKPWLESESDHRFELEWLAFLEREGLPVAGPVARRDGDLLGSIDAPEGLRYTALFRFAPGAATLEGDQLKRYGSSIAQIHLASDRFVTTQTRPTFDLPRLADRPLAQIKGWLGEARPGDVALVEALVPDLKAWVEDAGLSGDAFGIIGGDFHGGNHHFDGDRLTHFDFDLCGWGWRAYDLAIFRWAPGRDDEVWNPFLAGYESVRPLTDTETASIPVFRLLRHLWWMGNHTTYPSASAWLTEKNWDFKFNWLREIETAWREETDS